MYVRSLETIKGGGGSHSVGPHVLKDQPVTHLQLRQTTLLNDAIKAITCWTPDTARVLDLISLWPLYLGGRGGVLVHTVCFWKKLGHFDHSLTLCSVGKQ